MSALRLSELGSGHAEIAVDDWKCNVFPIPRHNPTGRDYTALVQPDANHEQDYFLGEYATYEDAVDAAFVAGMAQLAKG